MFQSQTDYVNIVSDISLGYYKIKALFFISKNRQACIYLISISLLCFVFSREVECIKNKIQINNRWKKIYGGERRKENVFMLISSLINIWLKKSVKCKKNSSSVIKIQKYFCAYRLFKNQSVIWNKKKCLSLLQFFPIAGF